MDGRNYDVPAGGISVVQQGQPEVDLSDLAGTGVDGLDEILMGGLPRNHLYILQGEPGVGKTTLAMQFLLNGRDRGETSLYVTLSETADDLRALRLTYIV